METLTQFLSSIADYLVYNLFGLEEASLFSNALHYFIIGFTQIVILVILVTYLMGVITSYLPMDKIRMYLEKNKKSFIVVFHPSFKKFKIICESFLPL